MNSLFNGIEHVGQAFGWGTLSSATEETFSIASRVGEVAAEQIEALGSAVTATTATAPLSLTGDRSISTELVQKIATYFTLQDWANFSLMTKGINTLLKSESSQREICPILYRGFEKLYLEQNLNITHLDSNPTARLKLALLEYKQPEPESIKSLKDHVSFLRHAGLLAELSEDGKAVIVTIPAGWSIEKLDVLSQAAVQAGIFSARIAYGDPSYRTVLQSSPIEKERRVAISNTVITDSRNKSTLNQKALLKAKGLEEEFPDPLVVLTVIVLRRILSNGRESAYSRVSQDPGSYTRTNKKTPEDWILGVGSGPVCVHVIRSFGLAGGEIGVGGLRKFRALGP